MPDQPNQLVLLGNSVSIETENFFSDKNGFIRIPANIAHFPSGEPYVELFHKQEDKAAENAALLKGQNVLVVQSGGTPYAENILSLQMMIYTLKRYGVASVTAYVQMLPLTRQDRQFEKRFVSEGASFMAATLKTSLCDKVITITPHSQASIKTFKELFGDNFIPLDTSGLFAADIKARYKTDDVVIGAPDGADKPNDEGQRRARELTETVFGNSAEHQRFMIAKEHIPGTMSETRIAAFDKDMPAKVGGKDCIIIDDMIDGGGTMVNAAALLKQNGAHSVACYATHGVLTGNALEKMLTKPSIADSPIDRLVITDTLPDTKQKVATFLKKYPALQGRIDILCTAPLVKEALAPAKSAKPHAASKNGLTFRF